MLLVLILCLLAATLSTSLLAGDLGNEIPPSPVLYAPNVRVLDVWPGLAPGETTRDTGVTSAMWGTLALENVTCPQLTVYPLPAGSHARHPAVLVFPGGGYQALAIDHEGKQIALWLNSMGYVAAVLTYRVPNKREAAIQDAERSLSLFRSCADEFNIEPGRIGVIGFSAGGHLAARLAAAAPKRMYAPIDAVDAVSCRPDFVLLVYPAFLIAPDGTPEPEVAPRTGEPPIFLTQTKDDPYLDAHAYASALDAVGAHASCIVYEHGGHGYGLHPDPNSDVRAWPDVAADWLRGQTAGPH